MKNWDTNLVNQLKAEIDKKFRLIFFNFSTPLYYTDCPTPLAYSGNLYVPRPVEISAITSSGNFPADKVSIELDMADRDPILLSFFVGEDPSDTNATIYIQALNASNVAIATVTLFAGKIDSYKYGNSRLSISITSFPVLWNKKTMESCSPSCRRNFKQSDCGYIGAESWCDRSYDRCLTLNNTAQFNGFRFLPAIEDKEIWWGRIPGKMPSMPRTKGKKSPSY